MYRRVWCWCTVIHHKEFEEFENLTSNLGVPVILCDSWLTFVGRFLLDWFWGTEQVPLIVQGGQGHPFQAREWNWPLAISNNIYINGFHMYFEFVLSRLNISNKIESCEFWWLNCYQAWLMWCGGQDAQRAVVGGLQKTRTPDNLNRTTDKHKSRRCVTIFWSMTGLAWGSAGWVGKRSGSLHITAFVQNGSSVSWLASRINGFPMFPPISQGWHCIRAIFIDPHERNKWKQSLYIVLSSCHRNFTRLQTSSGASKLAGLLTRFQTFSHCQGPSSLYCLSTSKGNSGVKLPRLHVKSFNMLYLLWYVWHGHLFFGSVLFAPDSCDGSYAKLRPPSTFCFDFIHEYVVRTCPFTLLQYTVIKDG